MKYTYATLLLNETGEEINERNLADVLDSANAEFQDSRLKALVAALEDVNVGKLTANGESQSAHPNVGDPDQSAESGSDESIEETVRAEQTPGPGETTSKDVPEGVQTEPE